MVPQFIWTDPKSGLGWACNGRMDHEVSEWKRAIGPVKPSFGRISTDQIVLSSNKRIGLKTTCFGDVWCVVTGEVE